MSTQPEDYWMTDADAKQAAAEFAPGIANREDIGQPEMLEPGSLVPYVKQLHHALRSGRHYDIRAGKDKMLSWATKKEMPKPGERPIALFQQPLHDESYSRYQGTIRCLVSGTQLYSSRGIIPIEQLSTKCNDVQVLAVGSRGLGFYNVKRFYKKSAVSSWLRLTLDTGLGERRSIMCGLEHGIYVMGRGFIAAKNVTVGASVLGYKLTDTLLHSGMTRSTQEDQERGVMTSSKCMRYNMVNMQVIRRPTASTDYISSVNDRVGHIPSRAITSLSGNRYTPTYSSRSFEGTYIETLERSFNSFSGYSEFFGYTALWNAFVKVAFTEPGLVIKFWYRRLSKCCSLCSIRGCSVTYHKLVKLFNGNSREYSNPQCAVGSVVVSGKLGQPYTAPKLSYDLINRQNFSLKCVTSTLFNFCSRCFAVCQRLGQEFVINRLPKCFSQSVSDATLTHAIFDDKLADGVTSSKIIDHIFGANVRTFHTISPYFNIQGTDSIQDTASIVKVISIESIEQPQTAYDIEVEDAHNYFAEGILVHNSGYGAGVVRQADFGKVLITHSDPNKIKFTVAHKQMPEDFTLVRMKDPKGKKPVWLMMNTTPTETIPYVKEKYKKIPAEQIDKLFDPEYVMSAKIDGAANFLKLMKDKVDVLSYRTSKKTGGPIIHTHRMGLAGQKFDIPKELQNTILRGEVYGTRDGEKAIPASELGGLLNSSVAKSLEDQKRKEIKLRMALFGAKQVGGKPWEGKTHEETRKIIQGALKYLPKDVFSEPPYASTPEEKKRMWESITAHKFPLTREGVVGLPVSGGTPTKVKPVTDYDVHIREIFPQVEGALKGKTAGGFKYSTTPTGPVVGEVGTGVTNEERKRMFEHPEEYVGRVARITAQEQYPSGAYRAPSYIARHEDYPVKAASSTDELSKAKPSDAQEIARTPIGQLGKWKICEVDGTEVRDKLYVDFVMGGNPYRYKFIPKDEIWIEKAQTAPEKHMTIIHEIMESGKMAKGESYGKAHDETAETEKKMRHAGDVPVEKSASIIEDQDPNMNSAHRRFVATDKDGKRVGSVVTQKIIRSPGKVELTSLEVHPEARGQGIAKRLVKHVIAEHKGSVLSLKPKGYGDGSPSDSVLKKMYKSMGFEDGNGREMLMKSADYKSAAFKSGLEATAPGRLIARTGDRMPKVSRTAVPAKAVVPAIVPEKPISLTGNTVATSNKATIAPVTTPSKVSPVDQYAAQAAALLKKYPKTPLTGQMLAKAWDTAGRPDWPATHAIAQGQLESGLGTRGRNPVSNPYNVGEFDKGTMRRFPNTEAGVQAYYKLMANKYLANGRTASDLQKSFINTAGKRYSSNPKYEQTLGGIISSLGKYLAANKGAQS